MKKLAFISDLIFTFFVSALLSLCLFRFIRMGTGLSLLLACVCGVLTTLSVGAFLLSRRKNLHLKKSDETKKQKLLLHLALLSDNAKTEFFRDLYSRSGAPAKRFGTLRLHTDEEFYFLHFKLSPVAADDVAAYARLKTGKKKILLCSQIEPAARELCLRLDITVKTGDDVYVSVKEANALPEKFLGDEAPVKKRKVRLKLWFAKSNARRFLVSGGMILLVSLLTPYFYYYLVFGLILLLAAVFIRVFGYE